MPSISMSTRAVNTLIVLGACVVYIALGSMSGRTSIKVDSDRMVPFTRRR